jgi:hypothetical protein
MIDGGPAKCQWREYHRFMKLDLDPDGLKVSMDLWRKATDMEVDLAPAIRSHLLTRRGPLLDGFVKVSTNWLTLLRSCTATGDDLVELEALRVEIASFRTWAETGILELAKLAEE